MTFVQLKTRCALRFRDTSNQIVTSWTDHLNVALYRFLAEADFPMEVTSTTLAFAAADKSKALPTDVYGVLSVRNDTDDTKLYQLDGWDAQVRAYPNRDEQGDPYHYRVLGNNLHLYPVPASAKTIEIFYRASPTAMSADGDTPGIPVRYHDALVIGALMEAYLDDADYERLGALGKRWDDYIRQAVLELTGSRHESYPYLRS